MLRFRINRSDNAVQLPYSYPREAASESDVRYLYSVPQYPLGSRVQINVVGSKSRTTFLSPCLPILSLECQRSTIPSLTNLSFGFHICSNIPRSTCHLRTDIQPKQYPMPVAASLPFLVHGLGSAILLHKSPPKQAADRGLIGIPDFEYVHVSVVRIPHAAFDR
jgi:hypothetical protein